MSEPCCQMRRKVALAPALIPEGDCGLPDSIVLDYIHSFEKTSRGRTRIAFKFCPWCGKPWVLTGETWELPSRDEESGEEWKRG